MPIPGVTRLLLPAGVLLLATGCAMVPEPIPPAERAQLVQNDRAQLFADQEPLRGPVSLEEAMARAIRYNLDFRLSAMEQALQLAQLDLSRYDLLPRLAVNAGFSARNNENASLSRNTANNFLSVDPSISSDQVVGNADLGVTWSVLDFGISYYQAKQQADRALIAQQRRRKVIHTISQQVRNAFWVAATAERVQARIAPALVKAKAAYDDSRRAEKERLLPPLDAMLVQKSLLEVIRQLETLEKDLGVAKAQLAALMNLPPDQSFSLALPPAFDYPLPRLSASTPELEDLALFHRPELQEEQYQKRISATEARKALIRLLPGVSLTAGYNYDTNSYLINNNWMQAGARATWNLLNLLSGPSAINAAEAQEALADARRMALSVAALTQVHVGRQQFLRAVGEFERANQSFQLERRIAQAVKDAETGQAGSPVDSIRATAGALVAEVARDRAYAEVQNAIANLYAAAGVDPLPEAVSAHDIATLSRALAAVNADLNQGRLHLPAPPKPEPVPVPASSPASTSAEPGGADAPTVAAPEDGQQHAS